MPRRTLLETSHGRLALEDGGGGGLPVLFIHGNSFSREVWRKQLSGELAPNRISRLSQSSHAVSSSRGPAAVVS